MYSLDIIHEYRNQNYCKQNISNINETYCLHIIIHTYFHTKRHCFIIKKTIKQCSSFITMNFPFKISFYILFFPHVITYLATMKEYIYNYFILLQINSFRLFQSLFYTNRMIFSYNAPMFLFRHHGDPHK